MSVRKREWITKAGEKRSSFVVDYTDKDGKRHIETFDKKGLATARDAEIKTDKRAGTHVPRAESITVNEAGENWIEQAKIDKLQRTTIEQYRQHLKCHIGPHLGHVKLADLTGPGVSDWERKLARAGVSEAMRRKVRVSLGSLISQAMVDGDINRNVVRDGARRKKRNAKKKRLMVGVDIPTTDEIRKLLEAAEGRFRPFFITAGFTGMRVSELRGLCWPEVDFKAKQIHVRQRADCFGQMDAPKTEAGTRTIPVGPFVMNTLKEWKLQCGASVGGFDLVFPTAEGNIWKYPNIRKRSLIPLMKKAGVVDKDGAAKYTGLHALRHFFASWCINRKEDGGIGLPPKVVQELLGHSSITMTMDVYGHLFPRGDEAKELAEAEGALLSATQT